jgi:hypothetical protein
MKRVSLLDFLRHFFNILRQGWFETASEADAILPKKSDDRRDGMVGL